MSRLSKIVIYALCDVRSGECFYVGKTVDPTHRASAHERERFGKRPAWKLIPLALANSEEEARQKEAKHILTMMSLGEPLVNEHLGSPGIPLSRPLNPNDRDPNEEFQEVFEHGVGAYDPVA